LSGYDGALIFMFVYKGWVSGMSRLLAKCLISCAFLLGAVASYGQTISAPTLNVYDVDSDCFYHFNFNAPANTPSNYVYELYEKYGSDAWGTTPTATRTSTNDTLPYYVVRTSNPAGSYLYRARICVANTTSCSPYSNEVAVTITPNCPSLIAPGVTLSDPGALTAGQAVTLNAAASISSGTLSNVEFYNGSTLIGTDTSAPYSLNWTPSSAGTVVLRAVANGTSGSAATSYVKVTIAAAPVPPTVSISSPSSSTNFEPGSSITISATASDTDGTIARVDFYSNGNLISSKTSSPYTISWAPAMGGYTLTAVATDNSGLQTTSAGKSVTVGKPVITGLDVDADCYFVLNLNAPTNVAANLVYEFYEKLPGASAFPATPTATRTTAAGSPNVPPFKIIRADQTPGHYEYRSRICLINTTTCGPYSSVFSVDVSASCQSVIVPTVNLTTPIEGGQYLVGQPIAIAATATTTQGTIASVSFNQGGTPLGVDTTSPYGVSWTPTAVGDYIVEAVADGSNGGTKTTGWIAFTVVSNLPPVVSLTSPANAAQVNLGDAVLLSANASDPNDQITKVVFYANDVEIGTDTTAPYQISNWIPSFGNYAIKAVATDAGGLSTTSTISTITVGKPIITGEDIDSDCYFKINLNAPVNVPATQVYEIYEKLPGVSTWPTTPTATRTTGSASPNTPPFYMLRPDQAPGHYEYKARICLQNSSTCGEFSSVLAVDVGAACQSVVTPTLSIVAPVSGQQYLVNQPISISANASTAEGNIVSVSFYQGGVLLGTDTTYPYAITWTPTATGSFGINAVAEGSNGGTTVTSWIPISVVNTLLPTVSLVSPLDGSSLAFGSTISMSALASALYGTISRVEFYVNDQLVDTVSSFPYGTSYTPTSAGDYTIKAIAYDNLGGSSNATSVIHYLPAVAAFDFNAEAPDNFKYDLATSGVPDLGDGEFVAATQGKLDVNNGAAQYSVAIDLPPAIRDLKPKLSLNYNSRSGNGLMGVGWNIGGLSTISRCRTSFAAEGAEAQKSNPRYSIGDRLCLDGQKLVLADETMVANDANYWASGATYKTEIDNFSKIVAYDSSANGGHGYFKVTTKDGRVLTYGRGENSQQSAITKPGNATGPIGTWALDKVEDAYGNNYTITYEQDIANGDYRPARINFAPQSAVVFTYQDRTGQVPWGYDMGGYYKHPKVLDKVTTYIDVASASNPTAGTAVKQYDVNYKLSAGTQRELVDTITECGYQSTSLKCAKPLTFSWQAGEFGFDEANPHAMNYCAGGAVTTNAVQFVDIDADGYVDILKKNGEVAWGTAANCFEDGSWVASGYDISMAQAFMTPRGYALLIKRSDKSVTPNKQVLGALYNINKSSRALSYLEIDSATIETGAFSTQDFNNDSLEDVSYRGKTYRQENTSSLSFTPLGEFREREKYYAGDYLIDLNGDGIKESIETDVNYDTKNNLPVGVYLTKGGFNSGWQFEANQTQLYDVGVTYFYQPIKQPGGIYRTMVDLNGDGQKDFVYNHLNKDNASSNYDSTEWLYRINPQNGSTGTEVNSGIVAGSPGRSYVRTNHYSYAFDYDKDGREDLLAIVPSGSNECLLRVLLSRDVNGVMKFQEAKDSSGNTIILRVSAGACTPVYSETQTSLLMGDINNDGVMDANYAGVIYYGKTKQPDLLTVVADGFGAETKVEYSTLVGDANNGKALYTPDSTKPAFPQVPGSRGMQVVKKVSTSNGKGSYNNRFYNYSGTKTDIQGRGFLGFANIQITDVAADVVTSTDYYQTFPYTGKPDTRTVKNAAGDLIASTKYTYGVQGSNSRFVYLDYSLQKSYQLLSKDLSSPLSATKVDNTFDACGNLTEQKTETGTGVNAASISGLLGKQMVVNTVDSYADGDCSDDFISTRTQTFSKTSDADDVRTVVTSFTPTNTTNGMAKEVLTTTEFSGTAQQKVTTITRTPKGVVSGSSEEAKDIDNGTTAKRELVSSDFEDDLFPNTITNKVASGDHVTTVGYNKKFGVETNITLPNLQQTTRVYDALGRLTSETSSDGSERKLITFYCANMTAVSCPTGAQYGVATRVTNTAAPGKLGEPLSIVYYDSLQREVRRSSYSLDGKSINVDTVYFADGHVQKTSEPFVIASGTETASNWSKYSSYDALGRAHVMENADGGKREISFATSDSLIKVTEDVTVKSPTATTTQTTLKYINALGQTTKVMDAKSTPVDYTYNSQGGLNTTKVNNNDTTLVTVDYDSQGNKNRIQDPDAGIIDFEYNGFGEMRRQTWQKGDATNRKSMTLSYDQLGRQTQRLDTPAANKGSPTTYTWVWDNTTDKVKMGRLVSESGNGQTVTYHYDSRSRVDSQTTRITGLGDRVMTYGYDDFSRPNSVVYPNGFTISRDYHAAGMAVKTYDLTDAANPRVLWAMGNDVDGRGNFSKQLWGNGVVTQTVFGEKDGQLTGIKSGRLSTTNKVDNLFGDIQALSYEYDSLGNVYSRSSNRTNGQGVVQESVREDYTYDSLNRLKTATTSGLFGRTNTYDYNELGNLTSRTSYMGTSTVNDDVGTLAYVPTTTNNAGVHAVTSAGGKNYKYDKYGNMVERGLGSGAVETIDYDVFNKPVRISGVTTTIIDYDANHERFREVSNGVANYSIAGGLYEEIVEGSKTTQKVYVDGVILNTTVLNGNVVASNDTLYIHTDGQGSSDAISDRLGAFVTRMSFSDWGERQKSDGKTGFPTEKFATDNGYTGHHQLDQHKLVHMGGRVYDPELGRFLSGDLFVQSPYSSQGFNRYSYVANNPLSRVDPSGYVDDPVDEVTVTGHGDSGGSFWSDWSYGYNYGSGWGASDAYFDYANMATNISPIDVSSLIQQPTSPDSFELDGAMEHVPVTEGKNGVDEITVTGCCKNGRGTGLHILSDPWSYERQPVRLNPNNQAQCAWLVRALLEAPPASTWFAGEQLTPDNIDDLPLGTAIATFVNGKYPNANTGQHAAFFMGKTKEGFKILEQYQGLKQIKVREVMWNPNPNNPLSRSLSNQAKAYSVVNW